jgi:hypothetical protein
MGVDGRPEHLPGRRRGHAVERHLGLHVRLHGGSSLRVRDLGEPLADLLDELLVDSHAVTVGDG